MLKELIKLANELDQRGLQKEADALDKIIKEAGARDVWDAHTNQVRRVGRGLKEITRDALSTTKDALSGGSWDAVAKKVRDDKLDPKKPKTDMDHAEEQQALKKKHKAQAAAQAKKKELERRLGETVSWFKNNIFVSTEADQFPLTADKDYLYGVIAGDKGWFIDVDAQELTIPKGTVFKDLKSRPGKGITNFYGGTAPSLKEIYNQMRAFIKKNKLNVPM
jgi:hypothetical protein